MYTEYVSRLFLNKAGLVILTNSGRKIDYETEVLKYGRLCSEIEGMGSYSPDFYIKGRLLDVGHTIAFTIDSTGPNTLYITGMRHESSKENFKLKQTKFSHYWQNKEKGYLFQYI